jgi:hypothetical protein
MSFFVRTVFKDQRSWRLDLGIGSSFYRAEINVVSYGEVGGLKPGHKVRPDAQSVDGCCYRSFARALGPTLLLD